MNIQKLNKLNVSFSCQLTTYFINFQKNCSLSMGTIKYFSKNIKQIQSALNNFKFMIMKRYNYFLFVFLMTHDGVILSWSSK